MKKRKKKKQWPIKMQINIDLFTRQVFEGYVFLNVSAMGELMLYPLILGRSAQEAQNICFCFKKVRLGGSKISKGRALLTPPHLSNICHCHYSYFWHFSAKQVARILELIDLHTCSCSAGVSRALQTMGSTWSLTSSFGVLANSISIFWRKMITTCKNRWLQWEI